MQPPCLTDADAELQHCYAMLHASSPASTGIRPKCTPALAAQPLLSCMLCGAYLWAGLYELPVLDGEFMELALHLCLLRSCSNKLVLKLLQDHRVRSAWTFMRCATSALCFGKLL